MPGRSAGIPAERLRSSPLSTPLNLRLTIGSVGTWLVVFQVSGRAQITALNANFNVS